MPIASVLGFTIELPKEWRGIQAVWIGPDSGSKMGGLVTMAAQASFRENLAFHVGPHAKSGLVDYLQNVIKTMNISAVKKEPYELDDAARAEIVADAPGGARVRQIIHAFPKGKETWMLTYSFLEGGIDIKQKRQFLDDTLATIKAK